MAVDLYVGPLCRYYTGQWETRGQQFAREQGIEHMVVEAGPGGLMGGPPSLWDRMKALVGLRSRPAAPDPAVVTAVIAEWQEFLAEHFPEDKEGFSWEEALDGPYFTDRPNWEGPVALSLLAARDEDPSLPEPDDDRHSWFDHPGYTEDPEELKGSKYIQVRAPDMWLPIKDDRILRAADPPGNPRLIGSTYALHDQLRELNERTYQLKPEDEWSTDDPVFIVASKFAMDIYLRLTALAVEHRLPMVVDG